MTNDVDKIVTSLNEHATHGFLTRRLSLFILVGCPHFDHLYLGVKHRKISRKIHFLNFQN